MTHKRRVKLTEDNVVIGEPLSHQKVDENNLRKRTPTHNHKKTEKSNRNKLKLVNESVQTDEFFQEKATQYAKNVPPMNYKTENQLRKEDNQRRKDENNRLNEELRQNNQDGDRERIKSSSAKKEGSSNGFAKADDRKKTKKIDDSFETEEKNKEVDTIKRDHTKTKETLYPVAAKTEYQRGYSWKKPIANAPPQSARTAELMSSLDTKLKIYNNFVSEYQRQFRPYEYVTESRYKKMKPTFESDRIVDNTNLKFVPEKVGHRRAVTPPPNINLEKRSVRPQETLNPQRLGFPHGKQKRFLTEYSANYDNKWDRLDAEMQKSVEEKAREANSQSKWFREILELRKKAQEYRQRSRGTHFSREHLGQVFGKSKEGRKERERVARRQREEDRSSEGGSCSNGNGVVDSASTISSTESTIVGKPNKGRSHSPSPQARPAGKPTKDNSLLLDEEASHDTYVKAVDRPYTAVERVHRYPVKNERQYTLDKYFNGNNDDDNRRLKTIDYESVSKDSSNSNLSNRSIISSSSRSLALETLERAKRNRDDVLRQKS